MFTLKPVHTTRRVTCTAAVAALVLAVLAMPASAGTTQISGNGVFNFKDDAVNQVRLQGTHQPRVTC
jgi:hypothetical protein